MQQSKSDEQKHFYLIGCVVAWIGIGATLLFWRGGSESALSYVANNSVLAYIVFNATSLVFVLCSYFFVRNYFFEHVGASEFFERSYYAALIMLAVTNLVPSADGILFDIHLLVGAVAFGASIVVYVQLATNKTVQWWVRAAILLATPIGTALFVGFKNIPSQLIFIALGQACILLVAYTSRHDAIQKTTF